MTEIILHYGLREGVVFRFAKYRDWVGSLSSGGSRGSPLWLTLPPRVSYGDKEEGGSKNHLPSTIIFWSKDSFHLSKSLSGKPTFLLRNNGRQRGRGDGHTRVHSTIWTGAVPGPDIFTTVKGIFPDGPGRGKRKCSLVTWSLRDRNDTCLVFHCVPEP